jgi:hypothetical protein
MTRYAVETRTDSGWENVWDFEPRTFASREEAQSALADHMTSGWESFERGTVSAPPSLDDYRIVEVPHN